MKQTLGVLCVVACLAGCGPRGVSPADAADRASKLYAEAMNELAAGRADAAVKAFEKVIRAEPGNANARFQLATLFEENGRDRIGAIANYREYIILRPDSDKTPIARARLKRCEDLFAADVTAGSKVVTALEKELADLRKLHAGCGKRIAEAEARAAAADTRARTAETDALGKKRLLAGLANDPDPVTKPEKIRPTDAELLDEEDDGTRIRKEDIAKLKAEFAAEEAEDAKNALSKKIVAPTNAVPLFAEKKKKADEPARPETYVVQEGDTLMQLAIRFYGSRSAWRRIQAANRAVISSDGRIKAGQEIRLP